MVAAVVGTYRCIYHKRCAYWLPLAMTHLWPSAVADLQCYGMQVIQEYENGKAIPAPAVLSKLSRVLGVQLSAKKK